MSYLQTETKNGITRRVYRCESEDGARSLANFWSGTAYEEFPNDWRVEL